MTRVSPARGIVATLAHRARRTVRALRENPPTMRTSRPLLYLRTMILRGTLVEHTEHLDRIEQRLAEIEDDVEQLAPVSGWTSATTWVPVGQPYPRISVSFHGIERKWRVYETTGDGSTWVPGTFDTAREAMLSVQFTADGGWARRS